MPRLKKRSEMQSLYLLPQIRRYLDKLMASSLSWEKPTTSFESTNVKLLSKTIWDFLLYLHFHLTVTLPSSDLPLTIAWPSPDLKQRQPNSTKISASSKLTGIERWPQLDNVLCFQEVTRVEVAPPGNGSEHCIQPAVTQFPSPILNKEQRQQGGVILHVVVAFYMFIGKTKSLTF